MKTYEQLRDEHLVNYRLPDGPNKGSVRPAWIVRFWEATRVQLHIALESVEDLGSQPVALSAPLGTPDEHGTYPEGSWWPLAQATPVPRAAVYSPPESQVLAAEQLLATATERELQGADALWRAHRGFLGGRSSAGGAPLPETLVDCRPVPAAAHLVMFRKALEAIGQEVVPEERARLGVVFRGDRVKADLSNAPLLTSWGPLRDGPRFQDRDPQLDHSELPPIKAVDYPMPPGYSVEEWVKATTPEKRRQIWLARYSGGAMSPATEQVTEEDLRAYVKRTMAPGSIGED